MHAKSLLLIAVSLIVVLVPTTARADQGSVRDHDITLDDYFTIGIITSCKTSPDGRTIAFTELRWRKEEDKRDTDIWVVDLATKEKTRLTFTPENDGSLRWSPDSRYIYFTSSRKRGDNDKPPYNGKTQVWRIPKEGGEPVAVTSVDKGVGMYDLSADGKSLYYTVTNEVVDDEFKDLRSTYSDLVYGHGVTNFTQVHKLDLIEWRTEKLIDENRVISDMKVSPDGNRIAMITRPDNTLLSNEGWTRADVFDVRTQKVTIVTADGWRDEHPSPYGWLGDLAWSPESNAIAFTCGFDGYQTEIYSAFLQGDTTKLRKLDRPDEISVTGHLMWRPDSHELYFLGERRARVLVCGFHRVGADGQGPFRVITKGDWTATDFDFAKAGQPLVFVSSTPTSPRDIYTLNVNGDIVRLTKVNPQVDTWKLPQISLVTWTGANGVEVEGVLELPPDYQPGKPLPLVVELHGGPTAATLYRLRYWIYGRTLLAAKGYALLSPNYRGSTGYGDKFLTDLVGHENDVEVKDILAGVDAMIKRGIADPDRLAVMGWSNGGLLTNCMITTTDRFKAASSGAGVIDMLMQWGTEDTPGHVINYMNGNLPWDDPDEYRQASPAYKLNRVTTPTIVHVGGDDPRCPIGHSTTLYRALRHYVKTPVELVMYPGEGHGLTTYTNRKAKMVWDIAWFEKYLGTPDETPAPDNAVKPVD